MQIPSRPDPTPGTTFGCRCRNPGKLYVPDERKGAGRQDSDHRTICDVCAIFEAYSGHALNQVLERNFRLEASDVRTDAVVRPYPEHHVLHEIFPMDIEVVSLWPRICVAVCA